MVIFIDLIIWILIILSTVQRCRSDQVEQCAHNATSELAFDRWDPTWFSAQRDTAATLTCCAHAFQQIHWQRYDDSAEDWNDVQPTDDIQYRERGQVLLILEVGEDDFGSYRCVATDSHGNRVNQTVKLTSEPCGASDFSASITEPGSDLNLLARPGDSLNVSCSGLFGACYNEDILPSTMILKKMNGSNMEWFYASPFPPPSDSSEYDSFSYSYDSSNMSDTTEWPQYDPDSPAPGVEIQASYTNISVTVTMLFSNLTSAHFGTYICEAHSGATANSLAPNRTITISEARMVTMTTPVHSELPYILAGVALLLCVVAVLGYRYHVDIRLRWKDKVSKPSYPDKLYDLAAVHNEHCDEARSFVASTLRCGLEDDLGYRMAHVERDTLPGAAHAENLLDLVELSQCVLFVITPTAFDNQWVEYLFQIMIAERYDDLIFIARDVTAFESLKTSYRKYYDIIAASNKMLYWQGDSGKGKPPAVTFDSIRGKFWKRLRLALPARIDPARTSSSSQNSNQNIFMSILRMRTQRQTISNTDRVAVTV